jgi:hypothetical protein
MIWSTWKGWLRQVGVAIEIPLCDDPMETNALGTVSPRYVPPRHAGTGAEKRTPRIPTASGLTMTYAVSTPGALPEKLHVEPVASV